MTRDFDDDCSRPDCEAPQNWCDAMAVAAFDSGLVLTNNESPSISAAIASAAERLAQWAEEPALAPNIERLMIEGCVAFDPPLIRAALADGAEIAISAALIHWPSAAADELKAVTRAQNLLAAGAKLGIAGSPSQAALDALDAAARLADPNGREGVSILVRPDADSAPALLADDLARTRAGAALAAGASLLKPFGARLQTPLPPCVARPEQTEGPYFVDEGLTRADIRTDPTTGIARAGTDLAADAEAIHIREHEIQHDGIERLTRVQRQARCPIRRARHAEARPVEIVADHLGKAGVVFDQEYAVGHGVILTAMPAPPVAPSALDEFAHLAPLIRGQHLRYVGNGLGEPLAGRFCQRHLLHPEGLDGRPVDVGLGQQGSRALPRRLRLLPQRQQVFQGCLGNCTQLVLLLARGVDLDGGMPDSTVSLVLDLGCSEGHTHEARPMPVAALRHRARGSKRSSISPPTRRSGRSAGGSTTSRWTCSSTRNRSPT